MTIGIELLDLATADSDRVALSTRRSALPDTTIRRSAAEIVADVAVRHDQALSEHSKRFGGSLAGGSVNVPPEWIEDATRSADVATSRALDEAIANARRCHKSQLPTSPATTGMPGVTIERVWSPLRRVGVYVPGGRALYPSSLIMGVVPARIAGVQEICVATPAGPDGRIDPIVLAAAGKLGITQMYAMGGAQAVGALAYGTESVSPVDKIVGPGGPWVTAAKLAVYGECGVDLPAGPSEAVIVADHTANAAFAAADVLCQAEHGDESIVVLVVTDARVAKAVIAEVEQQLKWLERSDVITRALQNEGLVVVAPTTEEALSYANEWAPEHLSIHTENPRRDADAVPNAGSVFLGEWTPEAAGDYATGANHVLPTGGLARAYGPLSVEDFGSWRQVQTLTRTGLESLAATITTLATAEGLTAHANSVSIRLDNR